MADRADTAGARGQRRHLLERPALDELLEAAELGDVQAGDVDFAGFVEPDRDLRVAFYAGDGVDGDEFGHDMAPQPNRALLSGSGRRPSSNAATVPKIVSAEGGQPGTKRSTLTYSWTGFDFGNSRGITCVGTP